MFIVLNQKALESPLIDVPLTGNVIMGVIAHGVSRRDSPHEIAHRTVPIQPQNEIPMIGQPETRTEKHPNIPAPRREFSRRLRSLRLSERWPNGRYRDSKQGKAHQLHQLEVVLAFQ